MRFHNESDFAFCEWMIRNVGVAAVPGSSFFKNGSVKNYIRLHFAKRDETLLEALDRLKTVREKLLKH